MRYCKRNKIEEDEEILKRSFSSPPWREIKMENKRFKTKKEEEAFVLFCEHSLLYLSSFSLIKTELITTEELFSSLSSSSLITSFHLEEVQAEDLSFSLSSFFKTSQASLEDIVLKRVAIDDGKKERKKERKKD